MIKLILVNTQEWIRLKFFQIVLFLSVMFVCFSYLLGSFSFTEQQRLLVDFGLSGIEIALVFVACFFSTHSLAKEIDRKTILVLLARPIPRWKILIGYFGSLALLNFLMLSVLGLTLLVFVESDLPFLYINYTASLFFIYIKSLVIGAFGLCIGVVARPMFAFVISVVYWLMSYSIMDLDFFLRKLNPESADIILKIINLLFPQFYKYNWKTYGFLKMAPNVADWIWASIHSFGWIVLFLYLSAKFFKRKEIV